MRQCLQHAIHCHQGRPHEARLKEATNKEPNLHDCPNPDQHIQLARSIYVYSSKARDGILFFLLSWIIMLNSGTWAPLLNFFFFLLSKYHKPLYGELVLWTAWQSLSVPAPMISPMLDDGGHSFTWPSVPVNVLDWLQDHCCDRNMSAVGDFHWTVTPRLWLCKQSKEERWAIIQWTWSMLTANLDNSNKQ